jgi:hypothetical protein
MKTLRQIREEIEVNEAEDKKLTTLIRAGLFDIHKLPLLKRALSKDNTKMSAAERNSLLDLLDTLIAHVTGDQAIFQKVRGNLQREDVNEVYEVAGELPMILILKRRSIRSFPDGQRVALYWADKLKTFISVPYSSVGVGYSPAVSEEVVLVLKEPLEEGMGNVLTNKKTATHTTDTTVWPGGKSETKLATLHHRSEKAADGYIKSLKKKYGASNVSITKKSIKEDDIEEDNHDDRIKHLETAHTAEMMRNNPKAMAKVKKDLAHARTVKTASMMRDKPLKENLETLQDIVNENTQKILNFKDGVTVIGPFTASAILEVYNAINDENKEKMKASLNESKVSFNKMAEFALSKV